MLPRVASYNLQRGCSQVEEHFALRATCRAGVSVRPKAWLVSFHLRWINGWHPFSRHWSRNGCPAKSGPVILSWLCRSRSIVNACTIFPDSRNKLSFRSGKYGRVQYGGAMPLNEPKSPRGRVVFRDVSNSKGRGPNAKWTRSNSMYQDCPDWSHVQQLGEDVRHGLIWLGASFKRFFDDCALATCCATSSATADAEICL